MDLDDPRRNILVTYMLELRERDDLTGKERMALYRKARAILEFQQEQEHRVQEASRREAQLLCEQDSSGINSNAAIPLPRRPL